MVAFRRTLSTLGFAGALLCWSVIGGVAGAATGTVYKDVGGVAPGHVAWMRSGPGPSYGRVGYLPANAIHVRTSNCRRLARGSWCQVHYRGTRGWVQDRVLRPARLMRG